MDHRDLSTLRVLLTALQRSLTTLNLISNLHRNGITIGDTPIPLTDAQRAALTAAFNEHLVNIDDILARLAQPTGRLGASNAVQRQRIEATPAELISDIANATVHVVAIEHGSIPVLQADGAYLCPVDATEADRIADLMATIRDTVPTLTAVYLARIKE